MSGMNWDRVRRENRARQHGTEPVSFGLGEMPISSKEIKQKAKTANIGAGLSKSRSAPLRIEVIVTNFIHSIVVAELRGSPIPGVPKSLKNWISEAVTNKGGVLQWAQCEIAYKQIKEKKRKSLSKISEKKTRESAGNDAESINIANNASLRDISAIHEKRNIIIQKIRHHESELNQLRHSLDVVNKELLSAMPKK